MLVAKCVSNRYDQYLKLMKNVSHHIVEGYMIHRELVHRLDKKKEELVASIEDKKVRFQALAYPKLDTTRYMENDANMSDYPVFCKKYKNAIHVQKFLADARLAEPENIRGISWLEIYILYRIRGFPKPLADPGRKAHNRATADKQIRAFKTLFRGVASRTMFDLDAHLFKPGKIQKDGLLGLAIAGNHG